MITQKYLRIAEILISIFLFASVWLVVILHPLGKPLIIIFTILICILYLMYNQVYFLDENSKIIPGKRAMRKKYGWGTSFYSQFAGFTCCLIALFGMRMMLIPMYRLSEAVYVLGAVLGGFLLIGSIQQRKNKAMQNVLLDGLRSMIIITIPYSFYVMMVWSTHALTF
jgi:hypothetical protein